MKDNPVLSVLGSLILFTVVIAFFIGIPAGGFYLLAHSKGLPAQAPASGPVSTPVSTPGSVQVCADPEFNTVTFACANPSVVTTFSDEMLAITCKNRDCGVGDNVAVTISATDAEGNIISGNGIVEFTNMQGAYGGEKGWIYLNEAFGAAGVLIEPGMTYLVTVTDPNDAYGHDLGSATVTAE